jgi:hypothetical protein
MLLAVKLAACGLLAALAGALRQRRGEDRDKLGAADRAPSRAADANFKAAAVARRAYGANPKLRLKPSHAAIASATTITPNGAGRGLAKRPAAAAWLGACSREVET